MPWILTGITAVGSLLFLPFTQDFYETTKWYGVLTIAFLWVVLWAIRAFRHPVSINPGKSFWALASLAAAGGISLLAASPNKAEAALSPFGPLLFAGLALVALLPSGSTRVALSLIPHPIALLAVFSLLQLTGITTFFPDPLWTPAGSTLGLLALLAMATPLLAHQAITAHKHGRQTQVFLYAAECILLLAAFAGTLLVAVPKFSSSLLPLWAGWQVMLESLKRFPAILVGVGPENFLSAFTAGRPPALNLTPVWNTRFLANASTALHLGTTTGLIGLGALGLFLISLLPRTLRSGLDWSRLLGATALLFLPPGVAVITFCAVLLLLADDHSKKPHAVPGAPVLATIAIIGVLGAGYLLIRSYRAEYAFAQAYLTERQANGAEIQRTGQKAIALNPYISRYHEAYAQTNLILAAAIAQQATQEETQTDEDRQVIAQLVAQAIREGKLATQLAPTRVTSWETLARLYQNLIGMAEDADIWAVASFQKAIELDPTNPGLRLELGSVYMAQGNFNAAVANFAVAAALKRDLANAHYNLAHAYQEQGNTDAALESLRATQRLLTEGTSDYEQVTQEFTALEATSSAGTK